MVTLLTLLNCYSYPVLIWLTLSSVLEYFYLLLRSFKIKNLNILYENENFIIFNKPNGFLTHPAKHTNENTLRDELIKLHPSITEWGEPYREGIVHRLDKVTSGLILCALNELTFKVLSDKFKKRTIKKTYISIIEGKTNTESGIIDLPLKRSIENRNKRTVAKNGRESITEFNTILKTSNYSQISINLITGRNHQIRAHMEYLKTPVVNDTLYGANRLNFLQPNEICLHSSALEFSIFDEDYKFKVDPPLFFNRVLEV